jgi:hypothetical protein
MVSCIAKGEIKMRWNLRDKLKFKSTGRTFTIVGYTDHQSYYVVFDNDPENQWILNDSEEIVRQ